MDDDLKKLQEHAGIKLNETVQFRDAAHMLQFLVKAINQIHDDAQHDPDITADDLKFDLGYLIDTINSARVGK